MVVQSVLMIGLSQEASGTNAVVVARQICAALPPPFGRVNLLAGDLLATTLPGTIGDKSSRIHAETFEGALASYEQPSEVVDCGRMAVEFSEAHLPLLGHVMNDTGSALRNLAWGQRLAILLATSQHMICFDSDEGVAHLLPFITEAARTNIPASPSRRVLLVDWSEYARDALFRLVGRGTTASFVHFVNTIGDDPHSAERISRAVSWLATGE
ncbi:MAG: hypothetical protein Q7R88_00185 [bacterium]|nr:hypothetical protein [bacterium]